MSRKPDALLPMLGDLFANMAIALVLAHAARWLLLALGAAPDSGVLWHLIICFAVLQADPMGSWRKGLALPVVALRTAIGAAIGAAVAVMIHWGTAEDAARSAGAALTDAEPSAPAAEDASPGSAITRMWWLFVVLPLIMLAPWLEVLARPRTDGGRRTAADLQIAAVFPIYLSVSFGLTLAVLFAFWVLELPVWLAGLLMLAAILICVTETWFTDPADLPRDEELAEWGPRPETAQAAWQGLRKAIAQSMVSALFMATVIYIALELAMPYFPGPGALESDDVFGFLRGFLAGSGVMMLACIGFFLAGALALVGAAWALGQIKGADPISIADLAQHASVRLFAGGIHHVRPDLDGE